MRCFAAIVLLFMLFASTPLTAQDSVCLRTMGEAFQSTLDSCASLGDNQICFGGGSVRAIPNPGAADLGLQVPGDRASLYNLQSVIVGEDSYGVALMKLHPDIGGIFHNQTISLVIYGSARVEAADTLPARYSVGKANVRFNSLGAFEMYTEPDSNSPVASIVFDGNQQGKGAVLGRSTDGKWVYIAPDYCSLDRNDMFRVPECALTGWIASQFLMIDGDISSLPVSDSGVLLSGVQPGYFPLGRPSYADFSGLMQNLRIQTGIPVSTCSGMPSGILIQANDIQTPQDLFLNGVHLSISGTVDVQASPDRGMIIRVLADEVAISASEGYAVGKPGTEFRFPTESDPTVIRGFEDPYRIDPDVWTSLPLGLVRDYVVPVEQVDDFALKPYTGDLPQTGLYQVSGDYSENGCRNRWGTNRSLASESVQVLVTEDWLNIEPLDRRGLLDYRNSMNSAAMFLRGTWLHVTEPDAKGGATRNPSDGVFITSGGYYNGISEIRLSSNSHLEGRRTFTPFEGCTQTWDYALNYVGPCVGLTEVSPGLQQCSNAP